jgi:hypothetical protein
MFQDFGAKALAQQPISRANAARQAVELIGRYPNLSEIELARVINLYRELSALDMALMLSDEELAPKLDHFSRDHGRRLRTPFRQYAALVGIAAAGIIVAVWAATLG